MSEQFYPRPEAQAVTWDELLPPVQLAVRDLLVRINGAHQSIKPKNADKSANNSTPQVGNCFVVYGSRGTGKTTVLLNAQKAICQKESEKFFEDITTEKKTEIQIQAKKNAQEQAKNLREAHLVWLEILDLEPLPNEANLLTVLLTQVRNALQNPCHNHQTERRSIFEEEADSARQLLDSLIHDSTLMWQNIKEPDTRNISSRQVKAADIYAGFKERFKRAMDKLVKELSLNEDNKISIVLPIDNIDRSTEHLYSIVKLAQLVSYPNLWLVIAGDRVEIETFLERSYWKELIRGNDGVGAQGKLDSDGEDEALVMARRQANAISQKLWPANHRVEVNFVVPKETLQFKYKQNSNDKRESKTIGELFQEIQIPTTTNEEQQKEIGILAREKKSKIITLLDFFDVKKIVESTKEEKQRLSLAAHYGLLLPARSVLDLWQLLDWLVSNDSSCSKMDFKAEKIARTMLRNAISSSQMPNAIAQKLQTDIIRRGEKGGTTLYFAGDASLKLQGMAERNYDFEYALAPVIFKWQPENEPLPEEEIYFRSELVIYNVEDITLSLKYNYLPIELSKLSNIKSSRHFVIDTINKKSEIELPLLVTAWLMILYDILTIANADSWVIGDELDTKGLNNISVKYTAITASGKLICENELDWNAPKWTFFWARNILGLYWQDFREEVSEYYKHFSQQQVEFSIARLLAAGWIFCVVKTSFELIKYINFQSNFWGNFDIPNFNFQENGNTPNFKEKVENFERKIILVAIEYYELIQNKKAKQKHITPIAYEIMIELGKWLETELIYFISDGYVPIKEELDVSEKRSKTIWKILETWKSKNDNNDSKLYSYWKENLSFILAELNEKTESPIELLFVDLYQYLKLSDR